MWKIKTGGYFAYQNFRSQPPLARKAMLAGYYRRHPINSFGFTRKDLLIGPTPSGRWEKGVDKKGIT
jgi:hypothetical protein